MKNLKTCILEAKWDSEKYELNDNKERFTKSNVDDYLKLLEPVFAKFNQKIKYPDYQWNGKVSEGNGLYYISVGTGKELTPDDIGFEIYGPEAIEIIYADEDDRSTCNLLAACIKAMKSKK